MADSSPMIEQYRRIKREHRDDVLFFRLGDFYEMFAEDATEISPLLNLTLTSRNGLPMCGVPYHASRSYIARLLRLGKKVAICEQISLPGPGKGLADRRVVEVITPGTTVDEDYLETGSSNYLAALAAVRDTVSFAYIEPSTGIFRATSFPLNRAPDRLRKELERLEPRELIAQESLIEERPDFAAAIADRSGLVVNRWSDWLFDAQRSAERLAQQFGTANLHGFGLEESSPEVLSAGALLAYLDDTAKSLLPHVRSLHLYGDEDYVGIDESSQRNLELVRNLRDGDARFTLLEVMDETKTAMGLRLLKRRILHPLRDAAAIKRRLDAVDALYRSQSRLSSLREALAKSLDLERLSSRVAMDRAHGKDLVGIRASLTAFETIEVIAREAGLAQAKTAAAGSAPGERDAEEAEVDAATAARLADLRDLLERGIADDPSILLTEGNLIRDGYDAKLDELKRLKNDGRKLLEEYLEEERRATGIASLKIRYNRLIGYFFEVTKSNLAAVPPRFIRRQGVVGGSGTRPTDWPLWNRRSTGPPERVVDLEKRLFLEIREVAKKAIPDLFSAAHRMAALDVAQSLARAATVRGWNRPEVDEEPRLRIVEGRHPVVEAHLPRGEFVPNDVDLDTSGVAFALVTGPNMAGKSTYLRQAALITLMAQIGSFVSAREARLGVIDRVFCRVGAADNLARGESTFLVEMNETANILRSATRGASSSWTRWGGDRYGRRTRHSLGGERGTPGRGPLPYPLRHALP
jgi:DNA mismatch repair protein MutS